MPEVPLQGKLGATSYLLQGIRRCAGANVLAAHLPERPNNASLLPSSNCLPCGCSTTPARIGTSSTSPRHTSPRPSRPQGLTLVLTLGQRSCSSCIGRIQVVVAGPCLPLPDLGILVCSAGDALCILADTLQQFWVHCYGPQGNGGAIGALKLCASDLLQKLQVGMQDLVWNSFLAFSEEEIGMLYQNNAIRLQVCCAFAVCRTAPSTTWHGCCSLIPCLTAPAATAGRLSASRISCSTRQGTCRRRCGWWKWCSIPGLYLSWTSLHCTFSVAVTHRRFSRSHSWSVVAGRAGRDVGAGAGRGRRAGVRSCAGHGGGEHV